MNKTGDFCFTLRIRDIHSAGPEITCYRFVQCFHLRRQREWKGLHILVRSRRKKTRKKQKKPLKAVEWGIVISLLCRMEAALSGRQNGMKRVWEEEWILRRYMTIARAVPMHLLMWRAKKVSPIHCSFKRPAACVFL